MADAKANSRILIPNMGRYGFQPIVTSIAAASLNADRARLEIEFVMNDDDIANSQLVEAHRFANRPPALIHVSSGLEEDAFFEPNLPFGNEALKALFPGAETVAPGNFVNRHKTNIMPVARVSLTWISQSDDQFHNCVSLIKLRGEETGMSAS